jgi:molecular chaperone Hsp33
MSEENETPQGLEVRTYFVRERNALVARADFGEMYVDYYLHQSTLGHRPAPGPDAMLKDALAALTLHCASRPWNETTAWTIHFADPLVNLFVTGDNARGAVVGQLFTDNVKRDGRSVFISDVLRGTGQPRRSIVELQDADVFHAVERYYEQSEQSPARLFRHGDEDFVMVSAPGLRSRVVRGAGRRGDSHDRSKGATQPAGEAFLPMGLRLQRTAHDASARPHFPTGTGGSFRPR